MSQPPLTVNDVAAAIIAMTPRVRGGFPTRLLPGQDYKAGVYYPATVPGVTSLVAKTANATAEMYFTPFYCRAAHTFTAIAFMNVVSVNTHKFHMGVYTSVAGYADTLLVDSGELTVADTNTSTIRAVTISQKLNAMTPYWLAWQADTNSNSVLSNAAGNYDAAMELGFLGASASIFGTSDSVVTGYYATNTYGALPPTAPAITGVTDVANKTQALIFLKG